MFIELKEIEIREINPNRKTNSGNAVSKVTYKDGSYEEYPNDIYEILISDTAYDATEKQKRITDFVAEKILTVLLDAEMKIFDVNVVLNKVDTSISFSIEKTNDILWGKDKFDRTLFDMNNILKNGKSKTDRNDTEVGGSKSDKSVEDKA